MSVDDKCDNCDVDYDEDGAVGHGQEEQGSRRRQEDHEHEEEEEEEEELRVFMADLLMLLHVDPVLSFEGVDKLHCRLKHPKPPKS